MGRTTIEWSPYVQNIMHGCSPVSEGCDNCYAELRAAGRLAGRHGYPAKPNHFDVTLRPEKIDEILRWRKPRVALVCSMGDLFHPDVPFEFIERAFDVFFSASVERPFEFLGASPLMDEHYLKHIFLALTKRPERMVEFYEYYVRETGRGWPVNVWPGISAENQARFDERVKWLCQIPSGKHFVSLEPLLGPIDLSDYLPEPCEACDGAGDEPYGDQGERVGCHRCGGTGQEDLGLFTDWIVFGAETGPNARPMKPDWARGIRDQARAAGVPCLLKSMGGKRKAGRELDGEILNEFPSEIATIIQNG